MRIVGIILLVLAALLLLLLLCRVGVIATYSADGLTVRARLGWFKLTLIPMPKRKPKQKRAKKKPKTEKKLPKQAENHPNSLQTILKGGSITQLKELLELALAAAGDMIRHLRVEYLRLHYTFAGQPDPAKAALRWGKANIGGDVIGHLLEQHVKILRREVTAEVDFCSEQSAVYAAGSCSIRVGAALLVTLRLLRSYLQWKKRQDKTPAQEEKTYG
mgnify:FL=1